MSCKKSKNRQNVLTVDYAKMGVMTIDEFKQALWTDLQILKDEHNAKYVSAPKLKLELTDKFGERLPLRDAHDGKPIYRLHTHHFRPACMDYDLK